MLTPITPNAKCPNPNFCMAQTCLGKCLFSYWYEVSFPDKDGVVIVRMDTKEEVEELKRTAADDWIIKEIEPQINLLNG